MLKTNGKSGWGAWAVLGLLLACLTAPAQAQIESLEDALTAAYNTNPTLLAQRAQLRATDELVSQAFSGWKPTITASGSRALSGEDATPGGINTKEVLSVSAQQTIFRGLQTPNEIREARDRVAAGRALLRETEQQVLLRAVQAYTDVLRDTAVVDAARSSVQGIERQLSAARSRRQGGRATRTDVAQAQARLGRSKTELSEAEAQLARSRALFVEVIGEVPGGRLQPPPALPLLPGSEKEAIERAQLKSPSVLQAKATEDAAQHAYQAARGALLPTVSLTAQYQQQDQEIDGVEETLDAAGLTARVTVPLYQAGRTYSRIRQARHAASESRLARVQAERTATRTATDAWEGLRSARDRIVSSKEEVRANEVALGGVRREAQVGRRTTLDVLDAEEELRDAQINSARARRDEYVAAFELLAAVGDLTVENINLNVQVYDPERGE